MAFCYPFILSAISSARPRLINIKADGIAYLYGVVPNGSIGAYSHEMIGRSRGALIVSHSAPSAVRRMFSSATMRNPPS